MRIHTRHLRRWDVRLHVAALLPTPLCMLTAQPASRRTTFALPQVFYVVPRVEHVERELRFLSELVPQVRLSYAFGGLKDLEQRIVDFTVSDSTCTSGSAVVRPTQPSLDFSLPLAGACLRGSRLEPGLPPAPEPHVAW